MTMIDDNYIDLRVKCNKATNLFLLEYDANHANCPCCCKLASQMTHIGCVLNFDADGKIENAADYKNTNRVICDCGWSGIKHNLVPVTSIRR